jgi:hypothetical protein
MFYILRVFFRCFICQMDVDTNCSIFKDSIQFLRRHPKMKIALAQSNTSVIASAPIVLGPPPPPPMKPETTKIILKGKQNNKMSASTSNSYGRWNRDSSVDWPLVSKYHYYYHSIQTFYIVLYFILRDWTIWGTHAS